MIEINDLCIYFEGTKVVDNLKLQARDGQIVSVVGESGSGKSVTGKSIMGFDFGAKITGSIKYNGIELVGLSEKSLRKLRGKEMTMIFQEPMTSLNPLHKVGKQIEEAFLLHLEEKLEKHEIKKRVLDAIEEVGLKEPASIYGKYPHELSGGMRQRIMIAMAAINSPGLLIADEPTTALDVATQDQIIALIKKINKHKKTTVIFITHNLKVARQISDYVYVMEKGKIVEQGRVSDIFENPKKEYTKLLVESIPKHVKLKDEMTQ